MTYIQDEIEVTHIITELEGSIDKFIGDAVLAVSGVPKAHEDNAVRTIMATQQIHQVVDAISAEVEVRIGRPLTMHTGIHSRLIVTGEMLDSVSNRYHLAKGL
jgi:class 3 adenylate cyclase